MASLPAAPSPPPSVNANKAVATMRGNAPSLADLSAKRQLKTVPAIIKTIHGVGKMYEIAGELYEMVTKDGASVQLISNNLETLRTSNSQAILSVPLPDGQLAYFVRIDSTESDIYQWFGFNYVRLEHGAEYGKKPLTAPASVADLLPFNASATFARPQLAQMIEGAEDARLYRIHEEHLLFLGSQDAARNAQGLKESAVRLVLNVATGIDIDAQDGIEYVNLPILDTPESPLCSILDEAMRAIDETLRNGGGVLVHCNAGVSRSASVVIAWLMKRQKLTYEVAYSIVKAVKRDICPNRGFVEQLRALGSC